MMKEKFDKRLIERRLRQGHITHDELEAHLSKLPDSQPNASVVEAKLESSDNKDDQGDSNEES